MLEGRQASRGIQRELLLYIYPAHTTYGSRSLPSQVDLKAYKLGSRLNESCSRLQQYGYRYLDALPRSRFIVQLSESPSVRG
jgi:hypothetical protein